MVKSARPREIFVMPPLFSGRKHAPGVAHLLCCTVLARLGPHPRRPRYVATVSALDPGGSPSPAFLRVQTPRSGAAREAFAGALARAGEREPRRLGERVAREAKQHPAGPSLRHVRHVVIALC